MSAFIIFLVVGFLIFMFYVLSLPSTSFGKRERPHQYGVVSFTERGESVKSYSEKVLADYFAANNIRYEYEPELRGIYAVPDFYLPDYDVYVEFWGLIDVPDKRDRFEYERRMRRKMARYYSNNIRFISIYPRNLENLDYYFRVKLKDITGHEFPRNN